MSIFSHVYNRSERDPECIKFLYTTRPASHDLKSLLFYSRLQSLLLSRPSPDRTLDLFLTGPNASSNLEPSEVILSNEISIHHRRLSYRDLIEALGPTKDRSSVVAYVCGPARMTDEVVDAISNAGGMDKARVLCEKWW